MNQIVDILCRARERYASAPSHAAMPSHPDPETYCVVTAITRSAASDEAGWRAIGAINDAMGRPMLGPVCWNAEHSTEEVLAVFDRAITAEGLRVPPLQRTERTVPVHAGQES